ncbi:MAG TPA: hypothetical protein VFY90_04785 [Tepidiformaceae bacterium]|nr:hypothetical protein [Tepidiformaceae bacterium]
MLDELFDLFERDDDRGARQRDGQRRGGVRGFLSRMFGGGPDDDDYRDEPPGRERPRRDYYAGEDDGREYGRRSHRRERDFVEFGDD